VIVHGPREHRATARQPRQPAGELRPEAVEVVGAHLVDDDQHDQGGRARLPGLRRRGIAGRDGPRRHGGAGARGGLRADRHAGEGVRADGHAGQQGQHDGVAHRGRREAHAGNVRRAVATGECRRTTRWRPVAG
jgi:hypothetical protein